MSNLLSVKNLSKTYIGGYNAINDVSFNLKSKGDKLAILGGFSSGKTTILSMIAGLESVTEGEIFLNDNLINDTKIKDRNIGYLDKSLQLDNMKNVAENIAIPLKVRKFDTSIITERVAKIAKSLDLLGILNEKISNLSQYQKTLVALARLMICERDLYIIDDIFTALSKNELNLIYSKIIKTTKYKSVICATNSYEIVSKLNISNVVVLAYNTMLFCGNIHDEENFMKTIAGAKLLHGMHICCLPAIISGNKLRVNNKLYTYNKEIVSDIFDKGIILLKNDKIAFDNSKQIVVNAEIYYINEDNVAYMDVNGLMATIDLNKKYHIGDVITFSFDLSDGILYDFESERRISK